MREKVNKMTSCANIFIMRAFMYNRNHFFESYIIYLYVNTITKSENDHFNSKKSLCKRCNTDMKEKLACEIYDLITASGLPLVMF